VRRVRLDEIRPWILDLSERTPPLRWEEIFAVPVRGVELEIGSGKGRFLREQAASRPETGFLGVERAGKWFSLCAERLARDGRRNVILARADAFDLLSRWVPEGCLRAIHVYFPDPWPKKRHAKRRLLCPALFDLAARALERGGILAIATDVEPYFAAAREWLAGHRCFEETGAPELAAASEATNYAVKYAKQGRTLCFCVFSRTADPPPPAPLPPMAAPGCGGRCPSLSSEASP